MISHAVLKKIYASLFLASFLVSIQAYSYEASDFDPNYDQVQDLKTPKMIIDTPFMIYPVGSIKTKMKDIIGMESVKLSVNQILSYLQNTEKYAKWGVTAPKGFLMHGPPGTGKTFIAQALAGELNCAFINAPGAQFNDTYIGVGQQRIKQIFKAARKCAPCIIFIDEVDSLLAHRDKAGLGCGSRENIANVNAFLAELDGVDAKVSKEPVFVILATNRVSALDAAVTRPGRIDQKVYVGMPDDGAKQGILQKELQGKPCAKDVTVNNLLPMTVGFSCADCTDWVRQAAITALESGASKITLKHFTDIKNRFGANRYPLSVGQIFSANQIDANFDSIIGCKEAKQSLKDMFDIFKGHENYALYNISIPKGLLMYGPPGNGKTRLAKAFAGMAGVSFIQVNGAEFQKQYYGQGAQAVQEVFEAARQFAPCVVFIDEIDAIGGKRQEGNWQNGTLNQLLSEMDGFVSQDPKKPVVVIGATNFKDSLDAALIRPGRFDRSVYIGNPLFSDRQAIIKYYASLKKCEKLDYAALAGQSGGMSGADIENWVNQANLLAAKAKSKITMSLLSQAWRIVKYGEEKEYVISDKQALETAQHEMGHALMMLKHEVVTQMNLFEVTIVPRGQYLGVCMQVPTGDLTELGSAGLQAQIEICLGGMIAEESLRGYSGSGVSSDLESATEIAREMVLRFGLGKRIGKVAHGVAYKYLSEAMTAQVDLDVQDIIKTAEESTRTYLTEKKAVLEKAAQELCKKKTLTRDQVKAFDSNSWW